MHACQLWQAVASLTNLLHPTTCQLTAMGLLNTMRLVKCKCAAGSKGRTLASAHAWTYRMLTIHKYGTCRCIQRAGR